MMAGLTLIVLSDVNGKPQALLSGLPSPLRVGDRLTLKFTIQRTNGGRLEKLEVDGDYRVTEISFDASKAPPRQVLSVTTEDPPKWRSVKKPPQRALASTKPSPTRIR
jgi:hypothetical protein